MIKNILLFFLFPLSLGLVVGSGWAYYQIKQFGKSKDQQILNGSWQTSLEIGSERETLFGRATVALNALFGLSKEEVIYFTATRDHEGNLIESQSEYVIEGQNIENARYWSITLYGEDLFLVPNSIQRFNMNAATVVFEKDTQKFQIYVSAQKKEKNWLPMPQKPQSIYLLLRLYNPQKSIYEHLDSIRLPIIKKIKN
ncbi:MAG: DUF1214 domain-containing protein [Cytophagales bacterium]|nr:MAG: DUF1214 domain-containing protein [Cytophagales bacterium]